MKEALSMLALSKSGYSVENIRKDIGANTPYRKEVLRAFDALSGAPQLRREVFRLLRTNSFAAVQQQLAIPMAVIRRISKETHAARWKVGRGRQLSPETRHKILARIRQDARSIDLRREFHISDWIVQKLRREIGDRENRLYRRGWDTAKVKEALAKEVSLSEIERSCKIPHAVLWKLRRSLGDFEDRRRRKPTLPDREEIMTAIRTGASQISLARFFHHHTAVIRALQIEAGMPARHRRRFTRREVVRIKAGIQAGLSDGAIARESNCTRGAIWARRKMDRVRHEQATLGHASNGPENHPSAPDFDDSSPG